MERSGIRVFGLSFPGFRYVSSGLRLLPYPANHQRRAPLARPLDGFVSGLKYLPIFAQSCFVYLDFLNINILATIRHQHLTDYGELVKYECVA